MRKASRFKILCGLGAVGTVCFVAGVYVGYERGIPFVDRQREWAIGIYEGPTPFALAPTNPDDTPALTARDVTDVRAKFVADPFFVREGEHWFLFFEVFNLKNNQGDIGVATSTNGRDWQYSQIVLDEPFHLSYPHVFSWEGTYYMVPESFESQQTRLYRAEKFPTHWKFIKTLVRDDLVDPTVFRYDNHWWMFASATAQGNGKLVLYHADKLTGRWQLHPQSPFVISDPNIARPAGSVCQVNGKLYRFAQDDYPGYGLGVRAFEITKLTQTEYEEKPHPDNPILTGTDHGWNADGMHQIDALKLESGRWLGAVDGYYWKMHFGLNY